MFDTIRQTVREDIRAAKENDPAATSTAEILLYAGLHAVWLYRVAHRLDERGHPWLARLLSQVARTLTGVEIHPRAEVGSRLFIDHGMGVVVGEVGDDVVLYHGVTLGGTSMERRKRHPTLGDCVVVGANATLLGPISVGDRAKVGAGAVVTKDVPAGATVAGNPAKRVDTDDTEAEEPSPTAEERGNGTTDAAVRAAMQETIAADVRERDGDSPAGATAGR
jgi:serine O-acetyltransferase